MANSPYLSSNFDIAQRLIEKNNNAQVLCTIASVQKVNADPVSVDVLPLINFFDENFGYTPWDVLPSIPVLQQASAAVQVKLPISVGDVGVILCFHREVFTCLQQNAKPKDPASGVVYDVANCFFLPFLSSFALQPALKPSGYDVVSQGVSLLKQLKDECDAVKSFAQSVANASGDPNIFPGEVKTAAQTLLNALGPISGNFTTFKGQQE